MDHDLLTVLIAAAESKSFREAAVKLQISQPAVSFKLKELELQQPIPIFQLEGKRKVLTHYGRALYELAKRDLAVLQQNMERLHRVYGNPRELTVRIGGRTDILDYLAPFLEFEGRIDFVPLSSAKSVEKLLNHEVDIAISYQKPDSTEIAAKPLLNSSPLFVVNESLLKGRKLTEALASDPKFLTETPCIFYNADGHLLKEWIEKCGLILGDIRPAFVIEEWRTIQALVDKGLGYAIVPSYVPISAKVQKVPVKGKGLDVYTFYGLYEKGMKKIPAFQKLLSFSRTPLQQPKG
jgi:DNA-binding transcriptional LysR family regulator